MLARKHECAGTCTPCMHSEVGRLAISRQAESTILEKPGTCVKGLVFAQDSKEGPIQLFLTWAEPEKSLCTGGKRWRASPSLLSQFPGPTAHGHFREPEPRAPRAWLVSSHWVQMSCTTASPLLLAACCTCWTRAVARECSCFTAIR